MTQEDSRTKFMDILGVGAGQHIVKYVCYQVLAQTGMKSSNEVDKSTLARKAAK